VHWKAHCATNEVETGTFGLSGSEAVSAWMKSPEHRVIITEANVIKVYIGWAWLAPSPESGSGGYVVVMDVCAATAGNQPNCL
jgi:hypothetical protein